ncbi:MAG TPA: hypothetical protein VN368_00655, partial [Candidatus Methylomirabilis sp.]|nr:hypothetical protein [Candidatus Methylomirabilis sp.]
MIIFKPPEVQKVLSGEKIETRRHGIKRWTVGSVHVARTNFRDEGVFAKIRITGESYQQELRMMREEDALREGNYTINDRCKEKFIDKIFARMACKVCVQRSTCFQYAWLKMNGVWKPDEKLWVVRFQKVDEKELETKNELKKEEFIERSENILSMADASRKLNIKVEKIKWLVKIGKIEVFRNDKSKTYIDISKINMDVFTNRKFVTIRRIEKLGYTKESIIGAILQGKVEFKQSKKGTWLININSADLSLFEKKLEIEK